LTLGDRVVSAYENLAFSQVCEAVLTLLRSGNKFIDDRAPWSLYKQGKIAEVREVLYSVLESVRLAAYLLSPIIPNISTAIYQQLGFAIDFNDRVAINDAANFKTDIIWGTLPSNQALKKPEPVFKRIEVLQSIS
jgi:methionyl-tRNA synthetase